MDIQFENRRFRMDRAWLEYYWKIGYRRYHLLHAIFEVVFIIGLVYFLSSGDSANAVLCGVFLFLYTAYIMAMPYGILRRAKKNALAVHNGKIPESILRFGDNIALTEGTISMTFEYSQIISFRRLRYSWLLQFGKQNFIFFDPGCFTVGDTDQFEAFIRMKCLALK